jgi:creatinine amidohydrolase
LPGGEKKFHSYSDWQEFLYFYKKIKTMAYPYILIENTWKSVQSQAYEVVVLPWGATEAHNYHLPFGTDIIETEYIARIAAGKAWEKGAKVVVLPAIPFGVNTSQLDIFMTMNMNPSTQIKILEDVLSSLAMHGIDKLVIFNGHGGNDFKMMIRELQPRFPDIFIVQLNWFEVVPLDLFFEAGGDHANEMETSVMMHIVPELVLPLKEAGSGKAKGFKFAGRKEGWVWFPRAWTKVTEDTGIGNPAKASAEKGLKYLEAITDKISEFFISFAQTISDDVYE